MMTAVKIGLYFRTEEEKDKILFGQITARVFPERLDQVKPGDTLEMFSADGVKRADAEIVSVTLRDLDKVLPEEIAAAGFSMWGHLLDTLLHTKPGLQVNDVLTVIRWQIKTCCQECDHRDQT